MGSVHELDQIIEGEEEEIEHEQAREDRANKIAWKNKKAPTDKHVKDKSSGMCLPCNFCRHSSHSVDGKCPKHCIPPVNAPCNVHQVEKKHTLGTCRRMGPTN